MNGYSHVLACIDISGEEEQVLDRAAKLAALEGATLSLVHVVRPLNYLYAADLPLNVGEIQDEITRQAQTRIDVLAKQYAIPPTQAHVVTGTSAAEIHRMANKMAADLVVIGTHGRHGLGLLLGSTANAVLHGTPCDVLAVKIHNSK